MVGGIVLQACLADNNIAQVTAIVRRSLGIQHPKLVEIIHQDFLNYSSIAEHFKNQDIAHFCIGAYSGQVSDDKFKIITFDFTRVFADVLKKHSPNARFCFLSGGGADPKEKSRIAFAKYKGMAENYLISKNFSGGLHIFRPAYIYPVEAREEPNLMYRVSRKIYPLLKVIYPNGTITSVKLGEGIFKAGMTGTTKMILENGDIKKI